MPYTGGYEAFVEQRDERRLSQQRAFEKQRRTIASEAGLHRAQHRRAEQQAGEGTPQAARAAAAPERAARRGRHDGAAARDGGARRRPAWPSRSTCAVAVGGPHADRASSRRTVMRGDVHWAHRCRTARASRRCCVTLLGERAPRAASCASAARSGRRTTARIWRRSRWIGRSTT